MEGLFPLSRMVAGGGVFGEEEKVLPSTFSMIMGMEMLPYSSKTEGAHIFQIYPIISIYLI
jgi:hypothetical protein